MRYAKHIFRTKGFFNAFGRLFQIFRRFLFGRKRFGRMLDCLENEPGLKGTKITFCVTANLLNRHRDLIERLARAGHELAGHGYYHSNMQAKSRAEQDEIIRSCYEKFQTSGLPIDGFRCPYLSYNDDTVEVFRSGPFSWVSNDIIYWQNGICTRCTKPKCFERLSHIYNSARADESPSLPKVRNGKIDIPISGPEDEMLVERCGIKDPAEISKIWLAMLDRVHERGELFHLIFHPERFEYVHRPFLDLVESARSREPGVWLASLDEIARWWRERAAYTWSVEEGPGARVLLVDAPRGATLLETDRSRDDGALHKHYFPVDPVAERQGSKVYAADGKKKPIVGLSPETPAALETFLHDEGFFAERSPEPGDYTLYIHRPEPFREADKLPLLDTLDGAEGRLLRIWRWPEGARSAFALSSDIDAITINDFFLRAVNY